MAEIMDSVYLMKEKCFSMDQRLMVELNLTQSELLFFSSLDNCQTINSLELSRTMGLSPSRVSRIVDKLVNNDYLDRKTDPADRRAIVLCLTSRGKKIKSRIDHERNECEKQLFEVMSADEIKTFREIVNKITKTI